MNAEHQQGDGAKVMKIMMALFLAMMLGFMAWIGNSMVSYGNQLVRLQEQMDSRTVLIRDIQETQKETIKIIQGMRDSDHDLDNRIRAIEGKRP